MQPHNLLPVKPFDGMLAHMDYLRLPGMGIGTIKFGDMRVKVEGIEGYHLIVFCLSGSARINTSGGEVHIDTSRGYFLPHGAPLDAEFSSDCEQLIMRIDRQTWETHVGSPSSSLKPEVDLSKRHLRPWIATLRDIIYNTEAVRLIQDHESVARSYELLLINLLLAGQGVTNDRSVGPSPGVVVRAERFLLEHSSETLRLEDVAAAAEVPPRTLLASFQRFRNTSPMRFLRDVRLDHAHAAIERNPDLSITSIALDCGFTHFGRFSQYYAQRFGESPSETRARYRSCSVRRQNIRHGLRRKLAECGPRLGVDVTRRACGVASADARWSAA